MKPLKNSINVILNTLAGKIVDFGTLADGRAIVYDAGTDQYTHVDLPQVTFETLLANGDVGTGANQLAYGNHLHTGVYELLANKSTSILTDATSDIKYPTVKSVKTYADAVAARISTGCTTPPDLIDNGDGTATITSTTVNIYPAPDYIGTMQTFVIPQATLSFTNGAEEFVSVRFNVGNPIYYKETVGSDMNHSDILPIFTVWRLGNVIHSLNFDSLGAGLANKAQSAMYHTDLYKISSDGGMVISETITPAPRTINVTASMVYTGAIHQDVGYFTSASDMMTEVINTPSGWTFTNKTVYNNTQINSGTTLSNINNNKYAVRWWYRSIGDSKQLFYVLGTVGNYNSPTDAALEQPRTDLPLILQHHCMLIGRSIISYNATNGVTQSLLSQQYSYSSVINHDDTANISLVGSGVTYGHINDQAQTIYGIKTFNSSPLVPTVAANTSSTVAASTAYTDAKVSNTITSGLTTIAPSQDAVFSALALKVDKSVLVDSKSLTGFLVGDGIDISYNWTNRTVTLTGDLRYMWRGVVKTLTSPWTSSAHTATLGNWYLMSSDGTNFVWSTTVWAFEDCMVTAVKYKAAAADSFAIRETHGVMDYQTHEELHSQLGTYLVSGGKPVAGTYTENTASDAATTPSFSAAVIKDEDNKTTVPLWTEGTYTTAYIGAGGVMTFGLTSTTPFIATTNTFIQVNNVVAGTMSAGSNNNYYNVYQILIPATSDSNSQKFRMVMLQPQATFGSLAAAQAEDTRGLNFGDIASSTPEYVVYSRITYLAQNPNNNIGKCVIATGGISYVTGNRASQISVSGIATNNHAVLSNLTWASSGHIGTASSLAGFDSGGLATNVLLNTLSPVAGSSSIVTVGTITSGTWSGAVITVAKGGTGLTAIGTALQVLRVNAGGTALEYVTPPWLTTAVTSVGVTVPTGLIITSGSPVTTAGTIAIGLQTGYSIPTTASQTNWDTAYTDRNKWDGGSTGLTASTGRTSLGATTVGSNVFTVPNPSAITFLRVNADNTVSLLDAAAFKTAIGAGSSSGTVTSVDMSVPVGLSISGNPVTSAGTLALTYAAGYAIPTTANQTNWNTAYSQTRQWDGGATGLVAATGRTSLGASTIGSNLFTLTNPSAVTYIRLNADNTVSTLDAATFRTAIGAGTSSTTGTVTSVNMSVPTGLAISGNPVTTSGTLALALASGYSIPTTANQTNWGTAYTYSQVGHLPLSGGTMSNTNLVTNLNADLFDGIHVSRFVYGAGDMGSTYGPSIWDSTNATQWRSGFWDISDATWTPTTSWYWGITIAHTGNSASYNYAGQILMANDSTNFFMRTISAGTPNPWRLLYHDGNFNPANYAPLASPTFTGTPTVPTATLGNNSFQIASTAFVQAALGGATGGAVVDDTAPVGATGKLWFEPDTGNLYTYAGGAWVVTSRSGINGLNGLNGSNGTGWTSGSFNSSTGIITFTSTDGLGFATNDLRATLTSGSVTYSILSSQLTGAITNNTSTWDLSASGIINCSLSANATITLSNLQLNNTIKVKLVITNTPTITMPAYCKKATGSMSFAAMAAGTYYVYLDCWNATGGSEIVVYSIIQAT